MDYTLLMQTSSFQTGLTRACRNITIQEDTIVEGTESFNATLIGTSVVVVNNTAGIAMVFIADNDGGKFASLVL